MSPYLAQVLGFSTSSAKTLFYGYELKHLWGLPEKERRVMELHEKDGEIAFVQLPESVVFESTRSHKASNSTDINLLVPRFLIVLCNIASNTIFAGQHVKLLHLIVNNNFEQENDNQSFDFHQDEYVTVQPQEISSIEISILDITGQPVKCEPIQPTRMQIQFVKTS